MTTTKSIHLVGRELAGICEALLLLGDKITGLQKLHAKLSAKCTQNIYASAEAAVAIQCVSEATGVAVARILNRARPECVALARFMFYTILRRNTALTVEHIGALLKKNHTTVVHGLKRAKDLLEVDVKFKSQYAQAERLYLQRINDAKQ